MKPNPLLSERRRSNLIHLITVRFGGNRSAAARAMGKNQNLVTLCVSRNPALVRNIGEKLARSIEEQSGLPSGSLDEPQVEFVRLMAGLRTVSQALPKKRLITEEMLRSALYDVAYRATSLDEAKVFARAVL